jgi:peptidylprolyl isomerase
MPTHRRRIHRSRKSKKPILIIGFLVAVAAITIVVYIISTSTSGSSKNKVLLSTSMGDIVIQLKDDMPITTENFKKLVQQGVYNNTIFHRVIADFMIQGGDPTGTGYGDPSIPSIKDEFTSNNRNEIGTIAMANTGQPDTGSSQFFINVVDNNNRADFDSKYPVFGKVVEGMDVVDNISKVATDQNDRPLQEVRIIKAELVD